MREFAGLLEAALGELVLSGSLVYFAEVDQDDAFERLVVDLVDECECAAAQSQGVGVPVLLEQDDGAVVVGHDLAVE